MPRINHHECLHLFRTSRRICRNLFATLIVSLSSLTVTSAFTCTDVTNVALAANGATASASSTYAGFAASGVVNGDRKGLYVWQDGYWSTSGAGFSAWLEVQFSGSKTISEIDVFAPQDNYNAPV